MDNTQTPHSHGYGTIRVSKVLETLLLLSRPPKPKKPVSTALMRKSGPS
jgi:hypothetical protein